MEKINFFGKTPDEISSLILSYNLPNYYSKEIALWLYKRGASSFLEMSNLSKKARELLTKHFSINLTPPVKVQCSSDGTKKYLYTALNNKYIETAYIPEQKRNTLCISSQVGCKMGCRFCMTSRQGLQGQLTCSEILNQIYSLPEKDKLTNLVFMGMGEPFDNTDEVLKAIKILTGEYGPGFSPKKINVSTIGLIPGIKRFIDETKCHLAISLHSPFNDERKKLMPVQRLYPIEEVIDLLKKANFNKQRRISFEYILFKGVNDSVEHVKQIARLLNGLRCRVNLMHFHTIPGASLTGADNAALTQFRDMLNKKGIIATIRSSRGEDIMAACGLLSTGEIMKKPLE